MLDEGACSLAGVAAWMHEEGWRGNGLLGCLDMSCTTASPAELLPGLQNPA